MANSQNDVAELSRMVARVQAGVLALVLAIVSGVGLFIMTAFLLIKGGANVGYHLRLLGQQLCQRRFRIIHESLGDHEPADVRRRQLELQVPKDPFADRH